MAESVGADVFGDAGACSVAADDEADVSVVETPSAIADKQGQLASTDQDRPRASEVTLQVVPDSFPEGHDPLLAALAVDLQLCVLQIEVLEGEARKLAHADPRGVEDLQHRTILVMTGPPAPRFQDFF